MLCRCLHLNIPGSVCFGEGMTVPPDVAQSLMGCVLTSDKEDIAVDEFDKHAESLVCALNEIEQLLEGLAARNDVDVLSYVGLQREDGDDSGLEWMVGISRSVVVAKVLSVVRFQPSRLAQRRPPRRLASGFVSMGQAAALGRRSDKIRG